MNLSPLEQDLEVICRNTDTIERCIEAIDDIRELKHTAKTVSDADDLADAKDFLFGKGNMFCLERNQEYQLMESQKAFVGEL